MDPCFTLVGGLCHSFRDLDPDAQAQCAPRFARAIDDLIGDDQPEVAAAARRPGGAPAAPAPKR